MMTLPCEKIIVLKSREVKTDAVWQNLPRKSVAQKIAV
jgi:hypothetical protein